MSIAIINESNKLILVLRKHPVRYNDRLKINKKIERFIISVLIDFIS